MFSIEIIHQLPHATEFFIRSMISDTTRTEMHLKVSTSSRRRSIPTSSVSKKFSLKSDRYIYVFNDDNETLANSTTCTQMSRNWTVRFLTLLSVLHIIMISSNQNIFNPAHNSISEWWRTQTQSTLDHTLPPIIVGISNHRCKLPPWTVMSFDRRIIVNPIASDAMCISKAFTPRMWHYMIIDVRQSKRKSSSTLPVFY